MLMAMAFFIGTAVKSAPVNGLPRSVLKIPGLPCFAKASSRASMRKSASMVIDTRWPRTRRLASADHSTELRAAESLVSSAQSTTAAR